MEHYKCLLRDSLLLKCNATACHWEDAFMWQTQHSRCSCEITFCPIYML